MPAGILRVPEFSSSISTRVPCATFQLATVSDLTRGSFFWVSITSSKRWACFFLPVRVRMRTGFPVVSRPLAGSELVAGYCPASSGHPGAKAINDGYGFADRLTGRGTIVADAAGQRSDPGIESVERTNCSTASSFASRALFPARGRPASTSATRTGDCFLDANSN